MAGETTAEAPASDDLGAFITEKLGAFDKRQEGKGGTLAADLKAAVKEKTKMDRIRDAQAEYAPLYEELLGSDKESAKTNALLLLSEAGLKLAAPASLRLPWRWPMPLLACQRALLQLLHKSASWA
jgi:hypothetical protein